MRRRAAAHVWAYGWHRQRLNTQYGGAELKPLPLDTTGVNDRIRVALGSRRLADAAKAPGTR
jgi:hypothetical protein